jgi:hypothetical protein
MVIISFFVSLAIILIFLGIGATRGFSFEVFFGLVAAGAKFFIELVKGLFN